MLTQIETERLPRGTRPEVAESHFGPNGLRESDELRAIAADRDARQASVIAISAAGSGPNSLGAR
jgi:hypothetical protein